MNNTVKNVMIFTAGVCIGSVATFVCVKDKYAKAAQDEIDDVKKTYKARYEKTETQDAVEEPEEESQQEEDDDRSVIQYKRMVRDARYVDNEPRVISPEEYGEDEEYAKVEYTYYADKVLADEFDDKVEDVDNTVGYDSLYHFGEYEADSVHIKNDKLKCYIEILLDPRNYSDVIKTKPHLEED